MDHFARLGMPAALDLEAAELDKAYFARQRRWHPDSFVARLPEEKAKASAEAAALNDAYRTLKDPLSRAVYFASLRGVELPGDGKTIEDPELLMEAMEAREALHEADAIETVEALAETARHEMQKALSGLTGLFLRDDRPALRKALLRLRYLDKFIEEARTRRANLERARA